MQYRRFPNLHTQLATAVILLLGVELHAANVLLVTSSSTINSSETSRRTSFQGWGHTVTTIQDSSSQSSFDTAVASADVVYVPATIQDSDLLYKLRTAACGVITETQGLDTEFGFATGDGYTQSWNTLEGVVNSHDVTTGLSSGDVVIFSSNQTTSINSNTKAAGFQVLGTMNWGTMALAVMETGGALANTYNSNNTASGRRVRMPWNNITWSALNSNGLKIVEQAIAWAAGGQSELVLHWKLNESSGTTASDSSGNGYNGTVSGTASWISARRNNGLDLNGLTKVQVTNLLGKPTSFTVAGWARLDAADTGGAELLSIGDYILVRLDAPSGSGTGVSFYRGSGNWETLFYNGVQFAGSGWHHVAATFDDSGNSLKLYIDGALVASKSTSLSLSWSGLGTSTVVGAHGNGQTTFDLDGGVDDIRVYNYALSDAELAEVYGLLAHWKLNETTGSTAYDSSLAGNNATRTGTSAWVAAFENNGHDFNYGDGEDYFVAPTNTALNDVQEEDYTVMAYFKPDSLPPGSGSANDSAYGFIRKNGWHIGLTYGSDGSFYMEHWLDTGPTWSGAGDWTYHAPQRFYHVAGVVSRTAGTIKIYVDGVLKETTSFTPNTAAWDFGTNPWRLGISYPGATEWGHACDGVIDDARIYNRALSDDEILSIAKTGLRAHWKLDETSGTTLTDSSDHDNSAAFASGTPTWVSAVRNNGLQFNGTNTADTDASFDPPSQGGVAFWFRPSAVPSSVQRLFGVNNDWEARLEAGGVLWCDMGANQGSYIDESFDTAGQWHHIVYNYNCSTGDYEIYLDGVSHKSGTLTLADPAANTLSFGTRTGSTELYAGALDDIRVYGHPLSASEVTEIYGLIGHWKMEEGTGSTLTDSSGAGNDATLSGATWTTDCSGNYALAFSGSAQTAVTGSTVDPEEVGAVAFWMRSSGPVATRQRPWGISSDFEMWQDTDGLLSCDVATDGYQGGFITSDPLDEEGRWYHVIAQYNSTDDSYEIYVNGELHKSGISTWAITDQAAGLLTFGTRTGATDYWEGQMRDFRIYNRHLLDYEIAEISQTAGHWPLDESSGSVATDLSVLTNDGAYNSNPTLGVNSVYAPENGTAVFFNGSSQYLEIPHNDAMLADNGTVMFWFRSADPTSNQGIFSKDSGGYDDGGQLTISLQAGKVNATLESTTDEHTIESPVVAASKWKHVAFTWGVQGMNLYVDGQLAASDPSYTGGLGTSSGGSGNYEPIVLGASAATSGNLSATPLTNYLQGAIDDVRCFGRAFCSEEVYKIYRGGRSPGVRIIQWDEIR